MPTSPFAHRFVPGLLAAGVALIFVISVALAPVLGDGGCMESYPMHCPIVEVVSGAFVGTILALLAGVALVSIASRISQPRVRLIGIVAGFVVLAVVMVIGANASLLHTTEVRYY